MDINLVQVLINVVGAPSARVVGSFGVRHGLQRAQRERAFERRLTWFETAIRVTLRFKYLVDSGAITMRETDLNKREQIMKPVVEETGEISRDLQRDRPLSLAAEHPKEISNAYEGNDI